MIFKLELKNKPIKGDIMIYNGKEFECITAEEFIKNIVKEELKDIKKEIKVLKGED